MGYRIEIIGKRILEEVYLPVIRASDDVLTVCRDGHRLHSIPSGVAPERCAAVLAEEVYLVNIEFIATRTGSTSPSTRAAAGSSNSPSTREERSSWNGTQRSSRFSIHCSVFIGHHPWRQLPPGSSGETRPTWDHGPGDSRGEAPRKHAAWTGGSSAEI